MSFPASPANGQIAILNGITYTYSSTSNSWTRATAAMPAMSVNIDTFTGDGVTTQFNLSVNPASNNLVNINIDGVLQQTSAYSISNNVLTLNGTPILGAIIEVRTTIAAPTSIVTGLTLDTFTGDGSTVNFTLSQAPTTRNFTIVAIGGIVQQKTTYTVSGSVLTFTTAPLLSSPIEIMTFGPAISSAMAGGANTQVQFNSGNVLAGSANLTFNSTTGTLATANASMSGGLTVVGTVTSPSVLHPFFLAGL